MAFSLNLSYAFYFLYFNVRTLPTRVVSAIFSWPCLVLRMPVWELWSKTTVTKQIMTCNIVIHQGRGTFFVKSRDKVQSNTGLILSGNYFWGLGPLKDLMEINDISAGRDLKNIR